MTGSEVEALHLEQNLVKRHRPPQVAAEDEGHEPVFGVVGQGDRLVLVGEGHDRRDRAEDLLGEDRASGADVVQHRRRVEVSGAGDALGARAHARAAIDRVGDEPLDLLARGRVDQRAELRALVEAVAHAHGGHGGGQARLNIEDLELAETTPDDKVLLVDEALARLKVEDPELERIVVLKFFGGLSNEEIAETVELSKRTLDRQWAYARAWLFRYISEQS